MSDARESTRTFPSSLRIRFAVGERPHIFWVGGWIHEDGKRVRYKVLSKSRPNRTLEVLVLQQGHARKALAHIEVPAYFPAGWLEQWVRSLGTDLGSRFQEFDLRHIQTPEEWTQIAMRLGWSSDRSTQT